MSRFDHLEFDDRDSEVPKKPQGAEMSGSPIRDAAYFCAQGDIEFHLDNMEPALRNYSRALEQDNTLYEGWFGQVRVLLEKGEYKEADLWAGKALDLFPKQPELLAVKAVAATRMGRKIMALANSDQALAQTGATPYVWLARADILLALGRPMAENCLAKALEVSSGATRGWTHWEESRLLRRHGRIGQGYKQAQEAKRLLPDEAGVWLELAIGQIALALPEARESLKQAMLLNSDCRAAQRLLKSYREPGFFQRLFHFRR